MSQTIRKYWGPFQGRTKLNFNWPIINHDSVVLITAAEFSPAVPSDEHRFMGAAPITVQNIAPTDRLSTPTTGSHSRSTSIGHHPSGLPPTSPRSTPPIEIDP
jgi:hypothetical protein